MARVRPRTREPRRHGPRPRWQHVWRRTAAALVASLVGLGIVDVTPVSPGISNAGASVSKPKPPSKSPPKSKPKPKSKSTKRSTPRAKAAAQAAQQAAAAAWTQALLLSPRGSFDGFTVDYAGVTVSGWAFDPETQFPASLGVVIDFVRRPNVLAIRQRPDVAAAFPGLNEWHGFSERYALDPGDHFICLTALNIARGFDRDLGCRVFTVRSAQPVGNFEALSASGSEVTASGWVLDPDGERPSQIVVTDRVVGSVDDPTRIVTSTTVSRPELGAFFGGPSTLGFSVPIRPTVAGVHSVCVTAVNRGVGSDRSLGCRTVVVDDRRPIGSLEEVRPIANGLAVSGSAVDPDTDAPVAVSVSVDGALRTTSASGPNRTFALTVSGLTSGYHWVCVTLIDAPGAAPGLAGNRTLPCGSVVVGTGVIGSFAPPAFGVTGAPGPPVPVGPGASSPIARVDRDGGISAKLRDGSTLWLFGDTSEANSAGDLRYFVSGTAAWASSAEPTVTRDGLDGAGVPFVLSPQAAEVGCEPGFSPGMWPLSAVAVPSGGRDRVIVYLADVCINKYGSRARGLVVAEWWYDPAAPPVGQAVQLTVLNRNLGTGRGYGDAAFYDATSGYINLYQCGLPLNLWLFDEYGPCRVARVLPATVDDTTTYRYWNGGSWVANSAAAAGMDLAAGTSSSSRFPVSSFTIAFDSTLGVYVMAYMPWPGYTDRVMVRLANSAVGPWSAPVEVHLPGCHNVVGGSDAWCYAGTAQPSMSRSGELGIGYYDMAAFDGPDSGMPARGAYLVARVPISFG